MLATVDSLKSRIRALGAAGTSAMTPSDDDELARLLEAASARILEAAPDRTIEPLDELELDFHLPWGHRIVRVPDLRGTAISATLDGVELDVTSWTYVRRTRELCALWVRLDRHHYGHGLNGGELKITGKWGPVGAKVGTAEEDLAVRADIADAALVWAARAWHSRAARFADTTQDPSGGVASYFRNLPPDVKIVVDSLEIPGV